jgi:Sigma-70 region 2
MPLSQSIERIAHLRSTGWTPADPRTGRRRARPVSGRRRVHSLEAAETNERSTTSDAKVECEDAEMVGDLISRATAGDEDAFRQLVEPYRRELHVHYYRILGSTEDAEDALQEALLAAWRGLDRFERALRSARGSTALPRTAA